MTQQPTLDAALRERDAHPTATAVCALLATEPRNQASLDAPSWVAPHLIGTAFAGLVGRKVLVWTGRWTTSTDRKGRNVGKPAKLYVWHGGRV